MRQVTHSCGMYWAVARAMLATPSQAAQIRAVWGLCVIMMTVTMAPMTKKARFASVTETAVRYVGGVYSEFIISEGRGMWWCS